MAETDLTCNKLVPPILSSFVDAFTDFSVSGFFLPPQNPKKIPQNLGSNPSRLLAIGDLHGDFAKTIQTLNLASLIDSKTLNWIGDDEIRVVQIGDVLDRGSDEIRLLYLIERLKIQSGSRFIPLLGNHEIMNIDMDFRYITQDSLSEFKNWKFWYKNGMFMKKLCPSIEPPPNPFKGIPKSFPGVKKEYWEGIRARIAALRPNGPISTRFLANNDTILVIGDSVFVHGGLIEKHITYGLDRINREVKEWINGQRGRYSPNYMRGRNSVVWLRKFSDGYNCDCESLDKVLGMIPGAKRMVMGHTIQSEGINGVCEGKALRIDVGISRGCGNGLPEVLEIVKGKQLRILTANPQHDERRNERRRVFEGKKEGLGMFEFEGRMKEVETKA